MMVRMLAVAINGPCEGVSIRTRWCRLQVAEEAFDTPVILFNPKLVDMQSTGYGLVGRELRTMVDSTFDNCFCLKSFVEGALFRVYPGWRTS